MAELKVYLKYSTVFPALLEDGKIGLGTPLTADIIQNCIQNMIQYHEVINISEKVRLKLMRMKAKWCTKVRRSGREKCKLYLSTLSLASNDIFGVAVKDKPNVDKMHKQIALLQNCLYDTENCLAASKRELAKARNRLLAVPEEISSSNSTLSARTLQRRKKAARERLERELGKNFDVVIKITPKKVSLPDDSPKAISQNKSLALKDNSNYTPITLIESPTPINVIVKDQ